MVFSFLRDGLKSTIFFNYTIQRRLPLKARSRFILEYSLTRGAEPDLSAIEALVTTRLQTLSHILLLILILLRY